MNKKLSRRDMLKQTGGVALVAGLGAPFCIRGQDKAAGKWAHGAVVGENTGMKVGMQVLAEGGNAIDAAVAAAMAACIATPARSGIGGYVVFDWEWREEAADAPGHPAGWATDFERRLWHKT